MPSKMSQAAADSVLCHSILVVYIDNVSSLEYFTCCCGHIRSAYPDRPHSLAIACRLSKLAGEELAALQASNFSSTGDISAHASGVRTLVLRVLKAAVSLTKAKSSTQKDQVSMPCSCNVVDPLLLLSETLWSVSHLC